MSKKDAETDQPISPSNLPGAWGRLVRFGFHLLYNEMAWTYDIVSWTVSMGAWRAWQLGSLSAVSGEKVLELAHGPGHMLPELERRGFQVTGCDLSAAMGRQASRRLKRAGLNKRVGLIRCEIPHFPFMPNSFDTVLSQFPTNFIFEPETLRQIHTLLADGGRLVVLPEGHLTGRGPLARLIGWLYTITGQTAASPDPIDQHLINFENTFAARLATAGFTTVFEQLRLKGSVATVVIATKSAEVNSST